MSLFSKCRLTVRYFFLVCISFGFILILLCNNKIKINAAYAKDSQANDSTTNKGDLFKELKVFTDVLSVVQKDYVQPVDNKKAVEGAIKGMLATLDPHSGYYDPEFYKDLEAETKGEFAGLGIEITAKDGVLVVVTPMEGSPAEKAGVRAGDSIVKIGSQFTKDVTLVDAVKKLRGPKGTAVKISVLRQGVNDLIDFEIVRDEITIKSVRGRYIGDGFAYVRLSQFIEKTGEDLEDLLQKLTLQSDLSELKGLILDLRNNPGGLLSQAIKVSDLFIESGVIVYTDGRLESQKQKYFAHSRGTQPPYPLVVLVNGGSASASEIVAGALKDHSRALILGTQTFGKGSVQTVTRLENGGALKLTTALYYTKSGHSLQSKGVTPDVVSDLKPLEGSEASKFERIRESNLPGAIKNPEINPKEEDKPDMMEEGRTDVGSSILEEVRAKTPESDDLNAWIAKDTQFAKAIELLKTFNIL